MRLRGLFGAKFGERKAHDSVQSSPISSWTVMVKDGLGHMARRIAAPSPGRWFCQMRLCSAACGMKRSIHSLGKRLGRPFSPMIAASTLASTSTSSPRFDLLRHEDAGAGDVLGAGVDGQDVVDAGRRAEIDLHAPDHPDDLLAMLAVGQLGVVDAGKPQIIGTAALEEFEIARVVDDAGEIGVGDNRPAPSCRWPNGVSAPESPAEQRAFTMFAHCAFLLRRPEQASVSCRRGQPDGTH